MKSSGQTRKKSSSSSRSKNYYGINGTIKKSQNANPLNGIVKPRKDVSEMQNNGMSNYQGGKFLRGRKYSFPLNQNEKRKPSDSSKINIPNQYKKLNGKNNINLMMLNINGGGVNTAYEDLFNYNSDNSKISMPKASTSNSRQNVIKYSTNSKKKKSNSAQSSPHRNGLKSTKHQNYPSALCVGLSSGAMNEIRPYSAKNSSYNRKKAGALIKMLKNENEMKSKTYSSKSKKGDIKRSNSKRGPTSNSSDFGSVFYN